LFEKENPWWVGSASMPEGLKHARYYEVRLTFL
jgi:hypothetical protein